ncbi:hypothetical protein E2C01_033945 [Portunus trituberculatus]|uniref:Uncharacterized protein n=1 Tax=Portunus trituberculatus TaxID=210409 RepID=A0A5B7EZ85_PORTR|nr:hypothetical protein [Portunus trituberculatus]
MLAVEHIVVVCVGNDDDATVLRIMVVHGEVLLHMKLLMLAVVRLTIMVVVVVAAAEVAFPPAGVE